MCFVGVNLDLVWFFQLSLNFFKEIKVNNIMSNYDYLKSKYHNFFKYHYSKSIIKCTQFQCIWTAHHKNITFMINPAGVLGKVRCLRCATIDWCRFAQTANQITFLKVSIKLKKETHFSLNFKSMVPEIKCYPTH